MLPKPPGGLLKGLSSNPNVSAFAKGQRMENAAGLGLENAQQSQKSSLEQMQQDSSLRQQSAANAADRAANESQERIQEGRIRSQAGAFDTSMGFDYASLQKRRNLDLQQALLNGIARSF